MTGRMNSILLSVAAVVFLVALLLGSTILVHAVDAKSKKNYKANISVSFASDCWRKSVIKLNDGIFGKSLAKKTFTIDPQSDESTDLSIDTTFSFDGKKVKKGVLQVLINVAGNNGEFIESVYDYQDFSIKQKTYNFDFSGFVNIDCTGVGSDSESVSISPGSSSPSNGQNFSPSKVGISEGGTVIWSNDDDTLHTVTSGTPEGGNSGTEFDSSYISAGKTFEHTFNSKGSFDYYCTLHPFMKGKIVVS